MAFTVRHHPKLFSVLAITLAVLLFNAYTIHVSQSVPLIVVGALIAAVIGLSASTIYLWWQLNTAKSSTTSTYVTSMYTAYLSDLNNIASTTKVLAELADKAQNYWITWAEWHAVDYLSADEFPAESVMKPVAEDLCKIHQQAIGAIEAKLAELDVMNDQHFTGDLDDYNVYISGGNSLDDIEPPFELIVKAANNVTAWSCTEEKFVSYKAGDIIKIADNIILEGDLDDNFKVKVEAKKNDGSIVQGIFYIMPGTLNIYPPSDEILAINRHIATIFSNAKNFAEVYWQQLKDLGYTSRADVPTQLLCPPPSVAIPDPRQLADEGLDLETIKNLYYAALNSLAEKMNGTVCGVTWTPKNVTAPKNLDKWKNVTITLPDGTVIHAEEVIPLGTVCNYTVRAGQDNVIQCVTRFWVKFHNGTVKIIDVPVGTKVNPKKITDQNGNDKDSTELGPSTLEDVINKLRPTTPERPPTFNYGDTVVNTLVAFIPLIFVVMVFALFTSMIRDISGRRR